MSEKPIPYGAAEIIEIRRSRKRPEDMVLVSLIGPLREVNPVIVANPTRVYDWSFLVDLEVLVVANEDTDKQAVRCVLDAIKATLANSVSLWLADRQTGQHLIIDGVPAHPLGLLRHMDAADRLSYAGLGLKNKDYAECE